jgi:hypothetical protein
MSRSSLALGAGFLALALGDAAHAACCRLLRTDTETTSSAVRACENDGDDGCAAVLFLGELALGQSQEICVTGETVVYQEWSTAANDFAAPVAAVCTEDADVEI